MGWGFSLSVRNPLDSEWCRMESSGLNIIMIMIMIMMMMMIIFLKLFLKKICFTFVGTFFSSSLSVKRPLRPFSLLVAMYVCVFVCMCVQSWNTHFRRSIKLLVQDRIANFGLQWHNFFSLFFSVSISFFAFSTFLDFGDNLLWIIGKLEKGGSVAVYNPSTAWRWEQFWTPHPPKKKNIWKLFYNISTTIHIGRDIQCLS